MVSYGTLPVEMIDQRATTMVKLNGQDTRIILDSGAFFNFMSRATAEQLGLRIGAAPSSITPSSTGSRTRKSAAMSGIGGDADIGAATVRDIGLLGATFHNAMFLVGGSDTGMPVVGANLLDGNDLDIDLAQGKLKLIKTSGCGNAPLAYWAKDGSYQIADLHRALADRKTYVTVVINGHPVLALIDTGATETLLARHAAERAGIDLTSSKVQAAGSTGGIGARSYRTWIAPIDKFQVGTETVQHSNMLVFDGDIATGIDAPDMLLGVDFVLAHHIYVANDQGKMYFTYNGGRMFTLAKPPAAPAAAGTAAAALVDAAGGPQTAADFALRARARLARGENAAAVADFDAAIKLEPGKSSYYFGRAQASAQSPQGDAGLADLNKALALDPQNMEALLWRAHLLMQRRNDGAARVDIAAARKLAPEGSSAALSIARFYMATDQPGEALPIYDAWIRQRPNDSALGEMLNARCWARGLVNRMLDAALADCRQAIRLDGAKADYLGSVGLVLLRQGKFTDAIAAYNKALAASPRLPWSLFGRGLAEKHSGQVATSTTDLNAARAIFPQIDAKAATYGITP